MGREMKMGAQDMLDLEEFLDDVRAQTGVSEDFLNAARPIVSRLFTDVPGEDRPGLAREIMETIGRHAQVEHHLRRLEVALAVDGADPAESGCGDGADGGLVVGACLAFASIGQGEPIPT